MVDYHKRLADKRVEQFEHGVFVRFIAATNFDGSGQREAAYEHRTTIQQHAFLVV